MTNASASNVLRASPRPLAARQCAALATLGIPRTDNRNAVTPAVRKERQVVRGTRGEGDRGLQVRVRTCQVSTQDRVALSAPDDLSGRNRPGAGAQTPSTPMGLMGNLKGFGNLKRAADVATPAQPTVQLRSSAEALERDQWLCMMLFVFGYASR
ncbi:hypothetical protein B0H10DRAFT_2445194 [Mycena sp. CBHHK59/15]|nr:hypothetical protein B0H10DRAFT_2445194 [Mycena sp. CBHHK59/15]